MSYEKKVLTVAIQGNVPYSLVLNDSEHEKQVFLQLVERYKDQRSKRTDAGNAREFDEALANGWIDDALDLWFDVFPMMSVQISDLVTEIPPA